MSVLRVFTCDDLFKFNCVNLDHLTETYGISFYLRYMFLWPDLFQVMESPNGQIMGYVMGKVEGKNENWHGHVTALSVAPMFRKMSVACTLIQLLEQICDFQKVYFMDLFVRVSNEVAISMYKKLGYVIYRRITDYYYGDPNEDAFDMRKSCSRDPEKKSMIPIRGSVRVEDID